MSKTLYRKYRPQNFSDVLGQDHIIKTLQNAIARNRIAHAYIFTGPRGTGKTSVARLFATTVNTKKRKGFTPVNDDVAQKLKKGESMDIIEIDAASSTSVEGIRTLRETVNITPSETIFKVYIIDEVHMLSTSAFNALLKTLEEPPEHVIFILATTEIHKVPETILSRCQRFDFSRFSTEDIMQKLQKIADSEEIKISPEALELIAVAANGGMRDAESLLAQVFTNDSKNITEEDVSRTLGNTTGHEMIDIISALSQNNISQALSLIHSLVQNGHNLEACIASLIEKLRTTLFLSVYNTTNTDIQKLITAPKKEIEKLREIAHTLSTEKIIYMIEEFTTALQKTKNSTIPQLPLEIAVLNICDIKPKNEVNVSKKNKELTSQNTSTKSEEEVKKENEEPTKNTEKSPITKNITNMWKKVTQELEKEHKSIGTTLSMCTIEECANNTLTISTNTAFYKEKILQGTNRALIENIMQKYFQKKMSLHVTIKNTKKTSSSELLSYATQIMGGTAV